MIMMTTGDLGVHLQGKGRVTSTAEKERLLRDTNTSTREMKITISKKELELLAQQVEMQGLTLEQVLANMVNGHDGDYTRRNSFGRGSRRYKAFPR
ncbi:F11F12.2-like protein [Hibiscus syriacus]|uniref:F11F12.2-like protein n=1 Tax=Hibiscus syriacus TaxID=106335 RepID=A0A6A2WEI0_HIBSY|nr:F11F12.2-like protein [Hibiscus syriacus]